MGIEPSIAPPSRMDTGRCDHRELCLFQSRGQELVPRPVARKVIHKQRESVAGFINGGVPSQGYRQGLGIAVGLVEFHLSDIAQLRNARGPADRILRHELANKRPGQRSLAARVRVRVCQQEAVGRANLPGPDRLGCNA